jgi:hypothetical protein
MLSSDSDAEFAHPTYKAHQSTEIEYPISCILLLFPRTSEGECVFPPLVVDASHSYSSVEEMGLLGPSNDSSKHMALLKKTRQCLEAS